MKYQTVIIDQNGYDRMTHDHATFDAAIMEMESWESAGHTAALPGWSLVIRKVQTVVTVEVV